jgi:hypothetical protein
MDKDVDHYFENYGNKISGKQGGAHQSKDEVCGVYKKDELGKAHYCLIKRDEIKPVNDIAEYIASKMFEAISPGSGCEIDLLDHNNKTYLVSKYFDNYQDLAKVITGKDRDASQKTAEMFNSGPIKQELSKPIYKGYEDAIVPSLLCHDYSVHSGNIGFVTNGEEKKLVRIDFGAAFRKFDSKILPFQDMTTNFILQKNYFLRDHPQEKIFCDEFSTKLKQTSKINLDEQIDKTWPQIEQYYTKEQMNDFGKQIGCNKTGSEEVKNHFKARMKERQNSLKDMATEIDLVCSIGQDGKIDKQKIEEIKKENPQYCSKLYKNIINIQFNKKEIKEKLKLVQELLGETKVLEFNNNQVPFIKETQEKERPIEFNKEANGTESSGLQEEEGTLELKKIIEQSGIGVPHSIRTDDTIGNSTTGSDLSNKSSFNNSELPNTKRKKTITLDIL